MGWRKLSKGGGRWPRKATNVVLFVFVLSVYYFVCLLFLFVVFFSFRNRTKRTRPSLMR